MSLFVLVYSLITSSILPAPQAILPASSSASSSVSNVAYKVFPNANGVTVYVHLPQESTPLSSPKDA